MGNGIGRSEEGEFPNSSIEQTVSVDILNIFNNYAPIIITPNSKILLKVRFYNELYISRDKNYNNKHVIEEM